MNHKGGGDSIGRSRGGDVHGKEEEKKREQIKTEEGNSRRNLHVAGRATETERTSVWRPIGTSYVKYTALVINEAGLCYHLPTTSGRPSEDGVTHITSTTSVVLWHRLFAKTSVSMPNSGRATTTIFIFHAPR